MAAKEGGPRGTGRHGCDCYELVGLKTINVTMTKAVAGGNPIDLHNFPFHCLVTPVGGKLTSGTEARFKVEPSIDSF